MVLNNRNTIGNLVLADIAGGVQCMRFSPYDNWFADRTIYQSKQRLLLLTNRGLNAKPGTRFSCVTQLDERKFYDYRE